MMTEAFELSDKDKADIATLNRDEPTYHTLLQIWRDVLEPAAKLSHEKVTPQWATNIIATHTGLTFADMDNVRDRYFAKLEELRQILLEEIDTDEECLKHPDAATDLEFNESHYTNLIMAWQLRITEWEVNWDTNAPDAAVELTAIDLAHKMFFGEVGLMAHLELIQYEFDESRQGELTTALNALREGR